MVKLSQKTTQKVSLYEYTDVKYFLHLQKLHDYCLDQQEVRKKHTKLDKLEEKVLKKIDAIPEDSTNMLEL